MGTLGGLVSLPLEQWQPGARELQFLNVRTGSGPSFRGLPESVAVANSLIMS